jgi:hypothetical protein
MKKRKAIQFYPLMRFLAGIRALKLIGRVLLLRVRKKIHELWKILYRGKAQGQKNSREEQIMLSRSVLLENSFKEAGVINDSFPFLNIRDSLATAFVLFESEKLNRIIVVDDSHCLIGVLDKSSILREFTPPKKLLSQRISSQDKYLTQRACNAIKSSSRESLHHFSHLIRTVKSFNEDEFLLYGIRYLLSNNCYLTDDLLAITDNRLCLTGTVSGKTVLAYLLKCIDFNDLELDVKSILSNTLLSGNTTTCLASDPLEEGLYIIDYVPTICILIRKNGKLVGVLTREIINQQIHPLYPEFLTCPMERFMKSVIPSSIIRSETSFLSLCNHLLEENEDEFVIIENKIRGDKARRNTEKIEHQAVSIKAVLGLMASKMILSY